MTDVKQIEEIYLNTKQYLNLDYLNEDLDLNNFDWDIFFEKYHENLIYETYGDEIFEILKDQITSNGVRHIECKFASNFTATIDAVSCKLETEGLRKDEIQHELKKVDTTHIKELLNVYVDNPTKLVLKIQFKDENGSTKVTNNQQNKAFFVLRNATKCFLYVMKLIGLNNVICLEMHVLKSEIKRLDLYKKILEREQGIFKNMYEDSVSDSKYTTLYAWR